MGKDKSAALTTPKTPKTPKVAKTSTTAASSAANSDDEETFSKDFVMGSLSPIAVPLADSKLEKKVLKVVKKASTVKGCVKRGVKEVVKSIRKAATGPSKSIQGGLVVLAGDVSPMDVLSHLPVFCEENNIPFIFVKSKQQLGIATGTKRATCCILIQTPKADAEYAKYFEEIVPKIKALQA